MTVTLYNGVTFKVEISFATDTAGVNTVPYNALASNIVWTDVTSYVRGVSIQRGRSNELDTFATGSATVSLDNRDRRFDPDFGPAATTFPGTSGNYLSTPTATKWNITGDLDIRVRCAPTSWANGSSQTLVGKASSASTQSYRFSIAPTGLLRLFYSTNGSTQVNVDSTVAVGFGAGVSKWVRVTRSATTGNVIFYTAPDSPVEPVTWTQLGGTVASVTTAYYSSTSPVEIGSKYGGTAELFAGTIQRVLVSSTIGGAAIGAFDSYLVTSSSSTTVVASTGETWTRNVSGSPATSWTVGSPYSGALNPMRPIRISATAPGRSMESMFVGFVDGWPQHYNPPRDSTVTLSCSDAFKVLSLIPLGSAWVDTVLADSPRAWLRLNEASGSATVTDTASTYTTGDPMSGIANGPFDSNPGYWFTAGYVASTGTQSSPLVISDTTDFSQTFDGTKWIESSQSALYASPVNYRTKYYAVPFGGCEVTFQIDLLIGWGAAYGICGFGATTGYMRMGAYLNVGAAGLTSLYVLVMNSALSSVQVYSRLLGSMSAWTGLGPHHLVMGLDSGGTQRAYLNGTAMSTVTTYAAANTYNNWTVGKLGTTGSATYTAANAFKGIIDEVVLYDYCPSATRVSAHYDVFKSGAGETSGTRVNRVLTQIGWPTDARDVDTGDSTVQAFKSSGTALSYLQEIERAEAGKMFIDRYGRLSFQSRSDLNLNAAYGTTQVSLTDSQYVDFQPNYTDQLIKNEISITRDGSLPQVRYDPVSQNQYFLRPENISGLLNDEDSTIAYMTEARLASYAYPRPRVDSVGIMPRGSSLWKEVIEYDIGTRISTTRSPQSVSPAITRTAIIEGIQHEISPTNWRTTWLLSPAEVSDFLVLDNPELDKVGNASARLGY